MSLPTGYLRFDPPNREYSYVYILLGSLSRIKRRKGGNEYSEQRRFRLPAQLLSSCRPRRYCGSSEDDRMNYALADVYLQ